MTERMDQNSELILGYIEGDLDDAQRAAFEQTLEQDHALRQLVSQMRLDREALRSLAGVSTPVGLVEQVMQAQERDALLGDPAAPEPLPRVVPVSRWKMRRVLAYSGVAAVLLLSFGVVLMTLTPPDILNNTPSLAQSEAPTGPLAGTERRMAMRDEDSVYDRLGERASGRQMAESIGVGDELSALAMKEKLGKDVTLDRLTLADPQGKAISEAGSGSTLTSSIEADQVENAVSVGRALASAPSGEVKDRAESVSPMFTKVSAKQEPYAGYAPPVLPDHVQLQIATASPTQARRDIRYWAIANSARVVEQSATVPSDAVAATRRNRSFADDLQVRGLALSQVSADTDSAIEPTNEVELVLFVEDSQVPNLLAYLNRGYSQRAGVVPVDIEAEAAKKADSREARLAGQIAQKDQADDAMLDQKQVRKEEPKAPTVALSNRWVDTGTVWQGDASSMEKSLVPNALRAQDSPSPRDPPAESNVSSPAETSQRLDHLNLSEEANAPDDFSRNAQPQASRAGVDDPKAQPAFQPIHLEDFFNWNKLSSVATQPADITSTKPQTQTSKYRRLEVVIRQVAEDELAGEAGKVNKTPAAEQGDELPDSP